MDSELELLPLSVGGESGTAYRGIKDKQLVFIKRNATPFLAAVSLAGIAPKLLWTKRTIHGEELTAQEWISSKILDHFDMTQIDILEMIRYVHQSDKLSEFLKKIHNLPVKPVDYLQKYQENLHNDLKTNHFLNNVFNYLKSQSNQITCEKYVVCHGDLNHRNFLIDENNRLYLVDWETARLSDPMSDIASFLCQYVQMNDWLKWIETYGMKVTDELLHKLEWYALYFCLSDIKKMYTQGRSYQMNNNIILMKQILKVFENI